MTQKTVMELLRQFVDNCMLANPCYMMGQTPITYWQKPFWDWETDKGPVVTSPFGMFKKVERLNAGADPRGCLLLWKRDATGIEEPAVIMVQGEWQLQKKLEDFKTHDATVWLKYAPRWVRISPDFMGEMCLSLVAHAQKDQPLVTWFMHRMILTLIPKKIYCWRDGDMDKEPEVVEV